MTNQLREMRDALMKTMSPKVLPVELVGGVIRLMRALAHGRPLTLGQASDALGVEADDTPAVLDRLEGMGMLERDGDGRVTGIVITTLPTSHRYQVGDVTLYTWCALDTLFMPAILDSSASVTSRCPESDSEIRLVVTPEGILECTPKDTHVSVVAPGITAGVDASCAALTGTCGSFCSNVHFLASQAAAEAWKSRNPGAEVFPVEEAFELAAQVWSRPFLTLGANS